MKTIYIHLANGFEEIEAITPVDVLRRAGCNVVMVSMNNTLEVTSARNITMIADKLFEELDYNQADMLVLPGGMPGSKHLDEHAGLKAKMTEHNKSNKWIAAICAAPMVLGHLGILQGIIATCYPGNETELQGAIVTGNDVECDKNIVTAIGAGASLKFSLRLVEVLMGAVKANEIKEKMMA